ncbi:Uncharacterized protein HZ326_1431 [Fusarium oxysporum f. sp. albedinis]|nr:Uncharacterized protein HZ326_1431 [Fusarium oxysporum f. sp. albedinis]
MHGPEMVEHSQSGLVASGEPSLGRQKSPHPSESRSALELGARGSGPRLAAIVPGNLELSAQRISWLHSCWYLFHLPPSSSLSSSFPPQLQHQHLYPPPSPPPTPSSLSSLTPLPSLSYTYTISPHHLDTRRPFDTQASVR